MGGGLMQLVAYGAQDIYLTGNPQITFFKVVYRRHTNFSMEAIEQTLNGSTASGSKQTLTVSRNGDLMGKVYLTMSDGTFGMQEGEAYDLVDYVDVEIGGQLIDRQHGDFNAVWWELTTPESQVAGLRNMLIENSGSVDGAANKASCYYPLNFWFCRNAGLALPLIALQYHEVKLAITWGTVPTSGSAKVWVDYIYLDTDERRRFAQVSHEYLIEQVQRQTAAGNVTKVKLNFNHPVKELIWVCAGDSTGFGSGCQFAPLGANQAGANTSGTAYTPANGDDEIAIKLTLNGHDRMAEREAKYFKVVQPHQHHTRVPGPVRKTLSGSVPTAQSGTAGIVDGGIAFVVKRMSRVVGAEVESGAGTSAITVKYAVNGTAITGGTAIGAATSMVVDESTSVSPVSTFAAILPPNVRVGVDAATATDFTEGVSITLDVEELPTLIAGDAANTSNVYCYSFALKPEEHQPSGTCNFSRIDTAYLQSDVNFANGSGDSLKVFAINYNVLRIMSGMGGLAYSN
jgi:hypothetical protein